MKKSQSVEVLRSVHLDGYSRSLGFLGYFSANGKGGWETAIKATERCFSFIGPELSAASVVTSAHVDFSAAINEGKVSNHIVLILERLVRHSLLRVVDYSRFGTDYGSKRHQARIALERNRFEAISSDQIQEADLTEFFAVKMTTYGVFGHCFLYLKPQELLLYPHDDIGFGIIAASSSADHNFGHEMLKFVATSAPFKLEQPRSCTGI
jgi:hypothetical protein